MSIAHEEHNQAVPTAEVAIIMRTKNRPLLLDRGIQDVLKQDYSDWVLMIVNDGGEGGQVEELAAKYAVAGNGRIHLIHHAESLGMEAASNVGIRATDSTFIVIHDDDDEWRSDFLQATVAALSGSEAQGVMVRTEIVYERVTGTDIEVVDREIFAADISEITLFDLLRFNRGTPISFLYRRAVHESIGYYDESLAVVGDWEFHLRFAAGFAIDFLDGEPRAFWNQRRESTGDLGNSVIARANDHRKYDLQVRERYLKDYVDQHGVGALLYLTKLQDHHTHEIHRRMDGSEQGFRELRDAVREQSARLDRLEAAIRDASLASQIGRCYRLLRDRLSRGQS